MRCTTNNHINTQHGEKIMSIERLTALQNDIRNTFNQWIEVSDKYLRTGLEDGHGRD